MILHFKVIMQSINRNDINEPVAGSIGYLAAKFTFTEDWDGLVKTAIFTSSTNESYSVVLANDACEVPHEVIKMGKMKVGVRGNNGEGKTIRITTSPKEVEIKASGILTGENPRPPTADEYSQVVALMQQQSVDASRAETAQLEAEKAAEDALETYGFLATEVDEQLVAIEDAGNAKKDEINAAGAVLYSSQALTEEQKLQSRTNIGAADNADLTAHKDNLSAHPWLFRSKNDLITKSVTGDSLITADDSAGGWIKGLTVYGKSVQNGTPTPDAPVAVNGVSGNLRKRGKNLILFPYPSINNIANGITWTVNIDGTITANGTATANSYFTLSYAGFMPIGVYRLSGCPVGGGGTTYQIYSGAPTVAYDTGNGAIVTTANNQLGDIRIAIYAGVTVTNLTFKPQLELGSVATPYEPYIGATYTCPDLQGIPLGATIPAAVSSNPALMSGVYHDGTQYWCGDTHEYAALSNGAWKQRTLPRMVKKVFNGTERWLQGTINSINYYVNIPDIIFINNAELMSAHFKYNITTPELNRVGYFRLHPTNGNLFINYDDGVGGAAIFKAFLAAQYAAGTPVTIYYLADAPVATYGDPIFIDAPKGTLNLYHTSDVQPHITADYPLDIKTYVDNKINEVTAAIAELSAT